MGNIIESIDTTTKNFSQKTLEILSKIGEIFNPLNAGYSDYGQTSPFSQIDRKEVQKGRDEAVQELSQKVLPVLSPSNYVASAIKGDLNPYKGMEIISKSDPRLQLLALGTDLLAARYTPKYAKFVKNNYSNRGRYFFDNVTPASYSAKNFALGTLSMLRPLVQNPPVFVNRMPKWYNRNLNLTPLQKQVRLETWARNFNIPETEIANTVIYQRPDKTYGLIRDVYDEGIKNIGFKHITLDDIMSKVPTGDVATVNTPDYVSTIGGVHTDYIVGSPINGGIPVRWIDVQKLNPQWMVTDPIKKLFKKDSYMYNKLRDIGGKHIGPLIGTTKDPVVFTQDMVLPYMSEPDKIAIKTKRSPLQKEENVEILKIR